MEVGSKSVTPKAVLILIGSLLLMSSTYGQTVIVADSLTIEPCSLAYKLKDNIFQINTEREFYESLFVTENKGECMPFSYIDFDKYFLVGYKYVGSNCDYNVLQSRLTRTATICTIQFSTKPNVCRDRTIKLVWFILDKPYDSLKIIFEKVPMD